MREKIKKKVQQKKMKNIAHNYKWRFDNTDTIPSPTVNLGRDRKENKARTTKTDNSSATTKRNMGAQNTHGMEN